MNELVLFIGPPGDIRKDSAAVTSFLKEEGIKMVFGGTAISIFERVTGYEAIVDIFTADAGIPPYGSVSGITAFECGVTLKKLNEVFFKPYDRNNSVSYIREKIKKASGVKIYSGSADNNVNGIDKKSIKTELIQNILKIGLKPVIVDY